MCSKRYNWSVDSFILNSIPLTNTLFTQQYRASLNDFELNSLNSTISLLEDMFVGEIHFTSHKFFTLFYAQLTDINNTLGTL